MDRGRRWWQGRQHAPGTFRLRILNLPGRYADRAPGSANQQRDFILVSYGNVTYSVHTARNWATSDRAYAHAFLEATTEDDGDDLRRALPGTRCEGIALVAEWAHDSLARPDG